ncbi:MAG: UDP-N-acetylmuramoyl-L-alanyl-D-glutamate--2,6-diaminopimelate ligase [Planctomycetota bacterium]
MGGSCSPARGDGPKITGVHLDSRLAGAGDLFAALPGTRDDGARFARDAAERGASAVLTPRALDLPSTGVSVPAQWVHPDARRVAGVAAMRVYGEPARDMFVVGITGTNGKTTTAHLTGQLLRRAGRRPAVLGTAGNRLADDVLRPTGHTTPDAPQLQRLLRDHRELGGDCVAMETSSHALDQQRTAGLAFDVGVFTNLTRDHLDYHHDLEGYAAAKEQLFANLRPGGSAVLNADDPTSDRFAKFAERHGARVFKYSARLRGDLCASQLSTDLSGSRFVLSGMGISRTKVAIPLIGRFNVENALAAAAAALLSGASPSSVLEGLASASSAPGRLEAVDMGDVPFRVLVDYAHTEAALENVCRVLRQSLSHAKTRRGRLIVVFGCGGDRDTGKRAPMGRAVNEFADIAIVTSDNPRSEDPAAIAAAIEAGMQPQQAERVVELDRRRAIQIAIERAAPGDVVLIAGKGHETTQTIGSAVLAFDDREVAAEVSR